MVLQFTFWTALKKKKKRIRLKSTGRVGGGVVKLFHSVSNETSIFIISKFCSFAFPKSFYNFIDVIHSYVNISFPKTENPFLKWSPNGRSGIGIISIYFAHHSHWTLKLSSWLLEKKTTFFFFWSLNPQVSPLTSIRSGCPYQVWR